MSSRFCTDCMYNAIRYMHKCHFAVNVNKTILRELYCTFIKCDFFFYNNSNNNNNNNNNNKLFICT